VALRASGDLWAKVKLVATHVGTGFSFIVAPHGTGTTVTFNLPGKLAVVAVILLVALVTGLAFVGVTYTKLTMLAVETTRLRAENEALRRDNQRIAEIQYEIAQIDRARRQIEAWAGVQGPDTIAGAEPEIPIVAPNQWPRRYSYDIMRPFYEGLGVPPYGMVRPAEGWISRRFIAPGGEQPPHPGVDIAAPTGTPVMCALDGIVKSAGWDDVYGKLIVLEHSDSLSTIYGHNDELLVKEGDYVAKGQVIARVGNTGRSTAPHLHFEVLKNEEPIDPELFVKFDTD
jgi:murein DD-endopeptidase MepM/ murein hydrolase activator NlpD